MTNKMADEEQLELQLGASFVDGKLVRLPKKPMSAFLYFCREKRKNDAKLNGVNLLEGNSILSQMWKESSIEDKQVYLTATLAGKEKYKREMSYLMMKYPDTVKELQGTRKRKSSSAKDESIPAPKKRGRKKKSTPPPPPPPPPPPLASLPSRPSPSEAPPPITSKSIPQTLVQEVKVPGTDISIFTPEFLEHNKKLNSQLMRLRRVNNDLQSENSRLEDSVSDQERNLATLKMKLAQFKQENDSLETSVRQLEDSIFQSFGGLVSGKNKDTEFTSAEELLQYIITNGVTGRALATAIKSFTVPLVILLQRKKGTMIKAILVFNNQGKPRLVKFFTRYSEDDQQTIIKEVYHMVSKRDDTVCNFLEGPSRLGEGEHRLIYRHYATLYFIFCVDTSESELGILDLIQVFVETLDRCFENVCELDLIFHVDKVHNILQEICMGGMVLETNITEVVTHIEAQGKVEKSESSPTMSIKSTVSSAPNRAISAVKNIQNSSIKLPTPSKIRSLNVKLS